MSEVVISNEIKEAFSRVKPLDGIHLPKDDPDWKLLFDYFNNSNGTTYGTGCRSCYHKVYYFVMRQVKK